MDVDPLEQALDRVKRLEKLVGEITMAFRLNLMRSSGWPGHDEFNALINQLWDANGLKRR